MEQEFSKAIQK